MATTCTVVYMACLIAFQWWHCSIEHFHFPMSPCAIWYAWCRKYVCGAEVFVAAVSNATCRETLNKGKSACHYYKWSEEKSLQLLLGNWSVFPRLLHAVMNSCTYTSCGRHNYVNRYESVWNLYSTRKLRTKSPHTSGSWCNRGVNPLHGFRKHLLIETT